MHLCRLINFKIIKNIKKCAFMSANLFQNYNKFLSRNEDDSNL